MHGGLLVRAALIRVCTSSLSLSLALSATPLLLTVGDRSAPPSIDKQTSGFEPDRMQRSEKCSKDSDGSRGEIRWFETVTSQIVSQAADPKNTCACIC